MNYQSLKPLGGEFRHDPLKEISPLLWGGDSHLVTRPKDLLYSLPKALTLPWDKRLALGPSLAPATCPQMSWLVRMEATSSKLLRERYISQARHLSWVVTFLFCPHEMLAMGSHLLVPCHCPFTPAHHLHLLSSLLIPNPEIKLNHLPLSFCIVINSVVCF